MKKLLTILFVCIVSSLLSGCASFEETISNVTNGITISHVSEGNYKDGKEDGKWTEWNENGQIEEEGNYKDREWTYWS